MFNIMRKRNLTIIYELFLFIGAVIIVSILFYLLLTTILLPHSTTKHNRNKQNGKNGGDKKGNGQWWNEHDMKLWNSIGDMRKWQHHYGALFGVPYNATGVVWDELLEKANLTMQERLTVEPIVIQLKEWASLDEIMTRMPLLMQSIPHNVSSVPAVGGEVFLNRYQWLKERADEFFNNLQRVIILLKTIQNACDQRIQKSFKKTSEGIQIVNDKSGDSTGLSTANTTWLQSMKNDIGDLVRRIELIESDTSENTFQALQKGKSAQLETVLQMNSDSTMEGGGVEGKPAAKIIDIHNNWYVLSRPASMNHITGEDVDFLSDILLLFAVSFLLGIFIERFCLLPSFLGHLIAGAILGPTGLNKIGHLMQISTLGQVGMLLIIMHLGLDFPIDRFGSMWRGSILGVFLLSLLSIFGLMFCGIILFDMDIRQAATLGMMISFSSTVISVKCMRSLPSQANSLIESLMAILIGQDVLFCLFLALLPHFRASTFSVIFWNLFVILTRTLLYVVGSWLLTRLVTGRLLHMTGKRSTSFLGALLLIVILCLGHFLGINLELAVFTSAILVSPLLTVNSESEGNMFSDYKRSHSIEVALKTSEDVPCNKEELPLFSLTEIASLFFFSSVGLIIDLRFLWAELWLLIPLSLMLTVSKSLLVSLIARIVLGMDFKPSSLLMGINLGQVSELALVLGGRARGLGLISVESYYMMAGVVVIGMITTPILWRVALSGRLEVKTPYCI